MGDESFAATVLKLQVQSQRSSYASRSEVASIAAAKR